MQRKLKAVFRSSSKRKSQNIEESTRHSGANPPRASQSDDRRVTSVEVQRRPQTSDPYTGIGQQNGHSRNLSSNHGARRMSGAAKGQPVPVNFAQAHPRDEARDSITSDYRAYLPVLSPDDSRDEKPTLGGDRRLIAGESEAPYEEDVANRNIDRYGHSANEPKRRSIPTSPPGMSIDQSTVLPEAVMAITMKNYVNGFAVLDTRDQASQRTREGSAGSVPSFVPSLAATGATGKYSLGQDTATNGGLIDRILPHTEVTAHEKNQWKNKSWPSKTARVEPQVAWSRRRPQGSESEDGEPSPPSSDFVNQQQLPSESQSAPREARTAENGQDDIGREIVRLLDGVVDLRNTVDEDKDVRWAPAVTHEVVKPHEHEIIQHKIYREIHNYEYYHRVQPVYHLEVLPPRHWKPNPDGEGLVEISADEVPWRTGQNRRWKIVQEQDEMPPEYQPVWRTEPEIIEHPTTITDEGFERKETTIIYPPTLQDMTEYDGPVQPVHFDHKTGKRWLGEITTMHKLRHELGQLADPDMSMKELGEGLPGLPDVPGSYEVPELSQSPELKRKPLNGPVPAQLGSLGRHEGIAVAV